MPEILTAKALRERRAPLARRIRELADQANAEGFVGSAEWQANWEAVNADYNGLTAKIERAERADAVDAEQSARVGDPRVGREDLDPRRRRYGRGTGEATDRDRTLALAAWFQAQNGDEVTDEQDEACRAVGFNPHRSQLEVGLYSTQDCGDLRRRFRQTHPDHAAERVADFRATLGTGSGAAGGYLIAPETMLRSLEINMLAYGGMRQVADSIRTATGEPLSWPTADDTSNAGAQLGESTTIGSSVDPSFGKVLWSAYKFSSKPILVPYELIQDAVFDLPSIIGQMFGERLGRITNTKYTTGTGAATPKGIVPAATTFSAASATAIASDDLLGLQHAVDPAYRSGAGWMLHDSILLAIRKLKGSGSGDYLWQSGLQDGVPDRLLGGPVTINQDMDSTMSSGKKTVLYGRLSNYKIRTVGSVRMYRLEERYRDTDQDGFVALIREDGNLLTAGTAPVKVLTH